MLCPNCQTINPPTAKFCLECGNRLVVCPNCGTVNLPVAKFCIECGTMLQPKGGDTLSPSTPATPISKTSQPDILLPPEERRVVTIMFADITGSTPLADRLDPEDMRAILTGYFNLMTEQIRKHGGTVEKYIGDAVMAVFGSPIVHEDDPDRAIRAALDMQTALTTFNEERLSQDTNAARLQMRIGINTGEVALPNNILHQRQDFLITGDAVNVAARLQQVATPDTILVGERTYLTTRDIFDFNAIAPLHLKGKPEPVPAYVVLGAYKRSPAIIQHPRGIDGRETPIVGRTLELTLMHASYARVLAERYPHLITILGTPGIGKSRLVREFIAREQESIRRTSSLGTESVPKVLQGRCPPYGESITYWPLIEILRSLLHVQEDETDEILQKRFTEFVNEILQRAQRTDSTEEIVTTIIRSIGRNLSNTPVSPEAQVYRDRPKREQINMYGNSTKQSGTQIALLRAWRVFLEALATQQPLIVVVDDLQWADEALLDLLEYLTERITNVPILFLCPARPDFFERRRDWGGGRRNFTTIVLEALNREESEELINVLLNANDLPEVLRNTILTRAEGNPFFLEEIVRMLIDQGVLICEEDHEHGLPCWRFSTQQTEIVSELNIPTEHPEDTLINSHYILRLPRVPDTVQGVLAARIDLLNPAEKLILQHAAIVGRTFWLSTLLELASDLSVETVLDALDSLIDHEFVLETEKQTRSPVEPDRVFTFKHILFRDVAYNNIPRMRRSREHALLALWLEEKTTNQREDFVELLAYHYQQAFTAWSTNLSMSIVEIHNTTDPTAPPLRLTRPELRRRAIIYLTLAGDQALHSYYTLRALQAYRDAFELLKNSNPDPHTLLNMHEKIGDAYWQRGNASEAWQEYRKGLQLVQEKHIQMEEKELLNLYARLIEPATRWLSWFDTPADQQEVRRYIDASLEILRDKPPSCLKVAFLTYLAFWYIRQIETASYAKKVTLAEQGHASGLQALQMAEQLNDPSSLSLTLDVVSFLHSQYHQYNEAHELQHRRQKLEPQLINREELYDLYMSLGWAHERVGDYSSSLMWFGRAWSNAQTMESSPMLINCMIGRMRAWEQWDRWSNAREVALEILRFIEQYQHDEKRQFWALETLATIAYRVGNQEEGDRYARQCRRLIDQQIERASAEEKSLLETKMHMIHLAQEDWRRAVVDYKEKLRSSEPLPSPDTLVTLAELLVVTGESAEVQASTCQRALELAETSGARKCVLIAYRARGRMYTEQQNWKAAEDDLRQALQRSIALDLPWEQALTLSHLGWLYKRRASVADDNAQSSRSIDLSRARYHFEQALGFFEALNATPAATRMRMALIQDNKARI